MNVRTGFHRLGLGLLALSWLIWLLIQLDKGNPAQAGYEFFVGLMMTAGYIALCRGIAWVFNGFFPPSNDGSA